MTASDDARAAIAAVLIPDGVHVKPSAAPYVLDVPMPDGRTIAQHLDALAEVEAERDVARKGTEDAIGELQYERKMRAENLRALWNAEAERDALRVVADAADKVWRCLRCNGGGMVAPGDYCPTCAGDGLRVEWADDGSDLRPLVEAIAALAADVTP